MKRPGKSMGLAALLIILCCTPILQAASPFSGCGMLVQGPNCLLFQPGGGPMALYGLGNYGPFHAGDHVCVTGQLQMYCQPQCADAMGCIVNNSISPANPPDSQYQACGSLIDQAGCMLFVPDNEPMAHLRLDNYGSFHVGNRVCVTGNRLNDCLNPCPAATGCIVSNSITMQGQHGSGFCGCGVIVGDSTCIMFSPGGDPFTRFVLSNAFGFQVGDTVRVFAPGVLPCSTVCQGAAGCLEVDSILFCAPPPMMPMSGHAVLRLDSGDSLAAIVSSIGSSVIDSIAHRMTYLLRFDDTLSVDAQLEILRTHHGVLFAEPNFETSLPEVQQMSISFPDENAPPLVYGVSPASYFEQPANYEIGIDSAHARTQGNGTRVAVIDNGIELTHPLFAGALDTSRYDFFDNDDDPSELPGTVYGHGTFVAGLIRLTAPESKLMPLRAFDQDGVGNTFAIAQAIYYAIDHGADIINMSFGVYDNSYLLVKACSTAVANGVTMVAATGNDSTFMPIFPAALNGVIAVSALDTTEAIAWFSNYGEYIDVCAPAVNLYSSLAGTYQWGTWSGTSFGAAVVSGTCALAKAAFPDLNSFSMEIQIRSTASKTLHGTTIVPVDPYYGYGCVNAAGAVWNESPPIVILVGDADGSGSVDISDAVYLCTYIFASGPPPALFDAGDANCDRVIDISDVVFLINYIFAGGRAPGCQ